MAPSFYPGETANIRAKDPSRRTADENSVSITTIEAQRALDGLRKDLGGSEQLASDKTTSSKARQMLLKEGLINPADPRSLAIPAQTPDWSSLSPEGCRRLDEAMNRDGTHGRPGEQEKESADAELQAAIRNGGNIWRRRYLATSTCASFIGGLNGSAEWRKTEG
ncbi:hypothetical protein B0H67DRAFT_650131 [Lasiosphaeris hirsuta]|uniref:Uncharacterized protein n=1 Tax=Lasiosphaeris hirsuta TaxID=260670 RepID=A0AA40DGL3_9PEZI|nr:hypothetical protein B0H67DRAFT_650131 [Lasiosphaeris hirsuta]